MSYADKVFKNMCRDIIENGTDTMGEEVRPHWPDGTPAYTVKKFGVVNRYDLRKEFPIITVRPTSLKLCTDELLWIWQKKSNNINDLHSHIWDEWADKYGSIGKAYGYQFGKMAPYNDITVEGLKKAFPEGHLETYPDATDIFCRIVDGKSINYAVKTNLYLSSGWYMDQVNRVIYDLHNTPYSRRILTSIYCFEDLHEMALYPCAYSMTFNVTKEKDSDKLVLNAILNQRSNDVLAANSWNVVQYAVLVYMIAQVCDMVPGEFVHMIADAHIYDRHIPVIKELIDRKEYPAPKFWINPKIKDFYDFTPDDVKLIDYQHGEQVKDIPIAI